MSDDDNSAAPAIGIDLGTAYSCVGVFQNGKVEIIPNDHFNRTTPSYVTFNELKWLAGEVAKNQWPRDPENTVFDAKRMIGRDFDDEELRRDMKRWPFKVLKDRGIPKVEVQYMEMTKLFTFEEMSSMVLTKMKMTAEAYLKKTVTKAVMTVPAHFTDAQRQATEKAGKMAGLDVMGIIDEPTAAVLANGLDRKLEKGQKVLIFDLGGGTFDVSVLVYTDQGFQVISTAGDAHFGGDDFDHRLVNYFANEFKSQHKIDPRNSPMSTKRLKLACEEAKKTLSNSLVAHVKLNSLFERIDFAGKVSRACFDELCEDLYRKTLDTVQRALDDANLKRADIDEVILAGGSTRIPKVRKLLKDFFDGKKLNLRINAVAFGATVQAAILSGQDVSGVDRQIDVIPYSLGVQEDENHLQILIKRNRVVLVPQEEQQCWVWVLDGRQDVTEQCDDPNRMGNPDGVEASARVGKTEGVASPPTAPPATGGDEEYYDLAETEGPTDSLARGGDPRGPTVQPGAGQGCEATLGQIKVPSYVNGKGQFKVDLPDAPIVNLFSLNFSRSLWSNLTSDLIVPDNLTQFLNHLTLNSDIQKNAINLKAFNDTIHKYQTLRNQLPSYHPLRMGNPDGVEASARVGKTEGVASPPTAPPATGGDEEYYDLAETEGPTDSLARGGDPRGPTVQPGAGQEKRGKPQLQRQVQAQGGAVSGDRSA
ncbi:Heat shock cognate protein [Amphibalanus amphitrite]|uniref:Heat shock cognate protein n=1 Tax=Amphibalanus amphitrite TaxID=1232801 RepID=A0A6A4VIN6_AMPAM|nr:Heat shock cognate protein [Amphibalanus amphitrite]